MAQKKKKSKPRKDGHTKTQKKKARFHLGAARWDTVVDDIEKSINVECVVPEVPDKELKRWHGRRALLKFKRSKQESYEEGKYLIYEYEYKENLSQTVAKKD